jgi:dihydrodipicolinate synthase/N-acetylneuraminate lyase
VRHGTALPSWADLEPSTNRRRSAASEDSFLEHVSTGRFALLILAIAGLFTLYVGHVHATTDVYNQLQQARAENQRLHLKHNRLKGAYDRRTGPSVIYERARALGLQESVTYGSPITVE